MTLEIGLIEMIFNTGLAIIAFLAVICLFMMYGEISGIHKLLRRWAEEWNKRNQ